jgi:hypothetical protein
MSSDESDSAMVGRDFDRKPAGNTTCGFRGTEIHGVGSFGWHSNVHTKFQSRARFTTTTMIHRPRRVR